MAIVVFSIGKKIKLATITPIKRGIPPARGIGFLWITAGCLCFLGSSMILNFFIKIKDKGVAITVAINAVIRGRKIVDCASNIYKII